MVNPAIHAAHAAAAKARKDVLDRLRQANATEATHALAIDGLARLQAQALERLVGDGVVRRASEHRYFLDEGRLRSHEERQRQKARLVLLSLLVAAILVLGALGLSLAIR
jgi:hypothetical protein